MTKLEQINNMLKEVITSAKAQLKKIEEIRYLTKMYRLEVLDVGKICEECGGEIIETDREMTCRDCGLVAGSLFVGSHGRADKNSNESQYRKGNTIFRPVRGVYKKPRAFKMISVYIDTKQMIKKIALAMRKELNITVSEILLEAMCDELATFIKIATGDRYKCEVTEAVRDELKLYAKERGISMTQIATQMIRKKYKEYYPNE